MLKLSYFTDKYFYYLKYSISFWLLINGIVGAQLAIVSNQFISEFPNAFYRFFPWFFIWGGITPIILIVSEKIAAAAQSRKIQLVKSLLLFSIIYPVYFLLSLLIAKPLHYSKVDIWQAIASILSAPTIFMDVFIFAMIVLYAFWNERTHKLYDERIKNELLSRENSELRLSVLKSQLNPHFIFNALNIISALITRNESAKAKKSISYLSIIFRFILKNIDHNKTKIIDELEYLDTFMKFQKLRFKDLLVFNINIDESCSECIIPCFLLQPIIENCVKFGSNQYDQRNYINLNISKKEERLILQVSNTSENLAVQGKEGGFGLGYSSTRKRLKLLYSEKANLQSRFSSEKTYITTIEIPYEK